MNKEIQKDIIEGGPNKINKFGATSGIIESTNKHGIFIFPFIVNFGVQVQFVGIVQVQYSRTLL